ncbi:MAG: SDR family NAD(P)-dependent oxidoreductase [Acidimicrobiales bacterium]
MNELSGELSGAVVVVTGASGAIGSVLSRAFADRSAAVAAVDIDPPGPVVAAIEEAGGEALGVVADLRSTQATNAAFREVLSWRGRVDVLVNMAGLYYGVPRVPFWEIEDDTWKDVVDGNLRTAYLSCQAFSAAMREAGRGRIVNVSSSVSAFGMENFMHYVSAKMALVGMTRAMARELGPYNIAVNAVAPGLVHTSKSVDDTSPDYLQQVVRGQCLKEPVEIEDVVNAVLFLSGRQSRLITGQTLLVNGGAAMGAF